MKTLSVKQYSNSAETPIFTINLAGFFEESKTTPRPQVIVWGYRTGGGKFTPRHIPALKRKNPDFKNLEKFRTLSPADSSPNLITGKDKLVLVREQFSLNITELAKVMNVTRPTIYDWLDEKKDMQDANRERLNFLYDLARKWDNEEEHPMGYRNKAGNPSFLDLINEETLDEKKITTHFDHLLEDAKEARRRTAPAVQKAKAILDKAVKESQPSPDRALIWKHHDAIQRLRGPKK